MSPVLLLLMAKPPSSIPSGAEMILRHFGVFALFVLVFLQDCGIPTLIPGSILVLAGGYFVYQGLFNLHVAALMIALGAFLGANLFFLIARRGGRPLVLYLGKFVGLSERQFDHAAHALNHWGPVMLLITRVAPGTRVYMTAFAGISGWTHRRFAFWTGIFALLWSYGFVLLGRALGPQWDTVAPQIALYSNRFIMLFTIALVIVLAVYIFRAWRRSQSGTDAVDLLTSMPDQSKPTLLKEQLDAHSDPRRGRLLRLADSPPPRQSRTRRRRR